MQPITDMVTELLAKHDLEGIIFDDFNLDEYRVEAEPIAAFIINNMKHLNETILADNIQYVWLRYCHRTLDYLDCLLIARDILTNL